MKVLKSSIILMLLAISIVNFLKIERSSLLSDLSLLPLKMQALAQDESGCQYTWGMPCTDEWNGEYYQELFGCELVEYPDGEICTKCTGYEECNSGESSLCEPGDISGGVILSC